MEIMINLCEDSDEYQEIPQLENFYLKWHTI